MVVWDLTINSMSNIFNQMLQLDSNPSIKNPILHTSFIMRGCSCEVQQKPILIYCRIKAVGKPRPLHVQLICRCAPCSTSEGLGNTFCRQEMCDFIRVEATQGATFSQKGNPNIGSAMKKVSYVPKLIMKR